jgi:hypothetical protein
MTRLAHSFSAYLRYMQMSSRPLFVFVEGKRTDPHFYGEICGSVCRTSEISYRICRSRELANGHGGKQTLISFFEYLRRKCALVHAFKGKSTGVLFFLDKDVDDLLRTQRRSPHVVYTRYYDVENHIFREADLIRAAAASASLDQQEVLLGVAWLRNGGKSGLRCACLLRRSPSTASPTTESHPGSIAPSMDPWIRTRTERVRRGSKPN